jgi:hypothetical protein
VALVALPRHMAASTLILFSTHCPLPTFKPLCTQMVRNVHNNVFQKKSHAAHRHLALFRPNQNANPHAVTFTVSTHWL